MGSVACAIPSRLSFGQEAFHSLGKPEETCIASLGTHTPTAQEMLGHRVMQSLDEERRESQRYHLHFFPLQVTRPVIRGHRYALKYENREKLFQKHLYLSCLTRAGDGWMDGWIIDDMLCNCMVS